MAAIHQIAVSAFPFKANISRENARCHDCFIFITRLVSAAFAGKGRGGKSVRLTLKVGAFLPLRWPHSCSRAPVLPFALVL